jgi:cell division protein FtsL
MFAKLLLIILVMGTTACGLLVNRQQRIETAHETAVLHQQVLEQRQQIWKLRCEVSRRCRPQQLNQALARLGGSWAPVVVESGGDAPQLVELARR